MPDRSRIPRLSCMRRFAVFIRTPFIAAPWKSRTGATQCGLQAVPPVGRSLRPSEPTPAAHFPRPRPADFEHTINNSARQNGLGASCIRAARSWQTCDRTAGKSLFRGSCRHGSKGDPAQCRSAPLLSFAWSWWPWCPAAELKLGLGIRAFANPKCPVDGDKGFLADLFRLLTDKLSSQNFTETPIRKQG